VVRPQIGKHLGLIVEQRQMPLSLEVSRSLIRVVCLAYAAHSCRLAFISQTDSSAVLRGRRMPELNRVVHEQDSLFSRTERWGGRGHVKMSESSSQAFFGEFPCM
jgi:hypothetical protein